LCAQLTRDLFAIAKFPENYYCCAMLCKRGLCYHAVSVCLSVRPSASQAIIVFFHTKRHGSIRTGTPLTGTSNAGGVGRNRDSELLGIWLHCALSTLRPASTALIDNTPALTVARQQLCRVTTGDTLQFSMSTISPKMSI